MHILTEWRSRDISSTDLTVPSTSIEQTAFVATYSIQVYNSEKYTKSANLLENTMDYCLDSLSALYLSIKNYMHANSNYFRRPVYTNSF